MADGAQADVLEVILVLPSAGLWYTLSQRTRLESEADAPQSIPPQGQR